MITKKILKQTGLLKLKKYREEFEQFVVEGDKLVFEAVNSRFDVLYILATNKWMQDSEMSLPNVVEISEKEMEKISSFKSSSGIVAVCAIPDQKLEKNEIIDNLSLVIDDINDPGNLGTIIRTADWFGIKNVICSKNSVDVYNPKVVQSSMGAIFRVNVLRMDIESMLEEYSQIEGLNIYGTYVDHGESVYSINAKSSGIIVMGSESHGISDEISRYTNIPVTIPGFSESEESSESLNVAIATAIVCSEFRRKSVG